MHLSVLAALLLLSAVASVSEGSESVLELLVVVDDTTVTKWEQRFRGNAKQDLIKFLNPIFYTLGKILQQQVGIELRIVDMHFLDPSPTPPRDNDEYLKKFTNIVLERNLPPRDHTLFLTGQDMYATGYAWVEGMCTALSQSVVQMGYDVLTTSLIAHELGHNFGCKHDSGGCSQKPQGNIMNAVVMPEGRAFRYSSCCADVIKSFVRSADAGCLKNISSSAISIPSVPFGQEYSADDLCHMAFGDEFNLHKAYYEKPGKLRELCDLMRCIKYEGNQYSSWFMTGIDGAVCADGKVCNLGKCTGSSTNSTGVEPTPGPDNGKQTTPRSTPTTTPRRATDSGPNTNCANGDKDKTYCATIEPGDCKRPDLYSLCCATCRKFETNVQGCPFGDEFVQYCADLPRSDCYFEKARATCCEKCRRVRGGIPGCEYGDRVAWCKPGQCTGYTQKSLNRCCETCSKQTGR